MTKTFEEYLADVEKYGDTFPILKSEIKSGKIKIIGPNNNVIDLKTSIPLNYGSSDSISTIYIEDSYNKQFSYDLNNKTFKLHLDYHCLYIDFATDYYYELYEFDTFDQFEYCQKNKELTIALLNEDKSDSLFEITQKVNLL